MCNNLIYIQIYVYYLYFIYFICIKYSPSPQRQHHRDSKNNFNSYSSVTVLRHKPKSTLEIEICFIRWSITLARDSRWELPHSRMMIFKSCIPFLRLLIKVDLTLTFFRTWTPLWPSGVFDYTKTWNPENRVAENFVTSWRIVYILLLTKIFIPKSNSVDKFLLEKLTCSQLVIKCPVFYGIQRFIMAFTTSRRLSLSWAKLIQSINSTEILEDTF